MMQDGRTKRKVETMRRVQAVALKMFEDQGFGAVTIERVAAEANVGAASVYRNFGTKEQLALWDEYDPLLLEAIAAELKRSPPLIAIRDGLTSALGLVYDDDAKRILRRARLIKKTPALRLKAMADFQRLREALTTVLKPTVHDAVERELLAAVVTSALDVGISRWVQARGVPPLATHLRYIFGLLAKVTRR
jgi:AcrR family transcriptional regulator